MNDKRSYSQDEFDTAILRDLIIRAFNDEEFIILCFDKFPKLYNNFSFGMTRRIKIQLLIEDCYMKNKMGELINVLTEYRPSYDWNNVIKRKDRESNTPSQAIIDILISEINMDELSLQQKESLKLGFRIALASVLQIDVNEINIINMTSGSVKFSVQLPTEALRILESLDKNYLKTQLGIDEIERLENFSGLIIYLFGKLRIFDSTGNITESISSGRLEAILTYLILQKDELVSREALISLFWPDQGLTKGRQSLSVALWHLRKQLNDRLIIDSDYIGFKSNSDDWIDVFSFEEIIKNVSDLSLSEMTISDISLLEDACRIYQDFSIGHFEDWILSRREFYFRLHLRGSAKLLHYYFTNGNYDRALSYAQKILNFDPLREEIHRLVIKIYLINNQRELAMIQYEELRTYLKEELGITPSPESETLYKEALQASNEIPNSLDASMKVELEKTIRNVVASLA